MRCRGRPAPPPANFGPRRSLCYLRLGRLAPALQDAKDALVLDPRSLKGWCRMGDVLQATGYPRCAMLCYRQAAAVAPGGVDHVDVASRLSGGEEALKGGGWAVGRLAGGSSRGVVE